MSVFFAVSASFLVILLAFLIPAFTSYTMVETIKLQAGTVRVVV